MDTSLVGEPNVARAHFDRAIICEAQTDLAGAIAAYETAVTVAPGFAEAYSNLGNLYLQTGRRDDALRAYAAAIRAKPDFTAVYFNLGAVLIDLGRYLEAIRILEGALQLEPDVPEAYANLGRAYRYTGRFDEAIAATRRALELRPDDRAACLDLAAAAFQIDAFDLALDASRRAVELDATSAETHHNRAWLAHAVGRYAEAIGANEAAISLRSNYADAHANLALSLLVTGEFARGWDEYIWAWRRPSKRTFYPYLDRAPLWNGETFAGRQLLITREQGFGDAIQMVRYLPAIKARGGRVALEVARELIALFNGLAGIDELRVAEDGAFVRTDVDLHVPILGIPRAFKTDLLSIPAPVPYLKAPAERIERWRPRMQTSKRLRVGIIWAGNADHANDQRRSAQFEHLAALGEIDGIAWFGMQKGRDEERRSCGALTLDPLGAEIEDFADTAAILTHLDLVIAVDTAIVHLAGAMGKPVWTLLAFAPDWRWMTERCDSPWYPTMRLFRQPRAGDWASVFGQVTCELRALAS